MRLANRRRDDRVGAIHLKFGAAHPTEKQEGRGMSRACFSKYTTPLFESARRIASFKAAVI